MSYRLESQVVSRSQASSQQDYKIIIYNFNNYNTAIKLTNKFA